MNYHLESELSTILFNIEQNNIRLHQFLEKNAQELTELNLYDKILCGCNIIDDATSVLNEVF